MRRVLSTGQLLLVLTAAPWWLAACGNASPMVYDVAPSPYDARIGFDTTALISDAPRVFDAFLTDQSPEPQDAYIPDTTPRDALPPPVDTSPPPDAPPPDAGVPADAE